MRKSKVSSIYSYILCIVVASFLIFGLLAISSPATINCYITYSGVLDLIISCIRIIAFSGIVVYPLTLATHDRVWKKLSIFIILPAFVIYNIFIFRDYQNTLQYFDIYYLIFHIIFGTLGVLYPALLIFYDSYTITRHFWVGCLALLGVCSMLIPLYTLEAIVPQFPDLLLYSHYGLWWIVRIVFLAFFIPIILMLPKIRHSSMRVILWILLASNIYHGALRIGRALLTHSITAIYYYLPLNVLDIIGILLPIAVLFDIKYLYKMLVPLGLAIPIIKLFVYDPSMMPVLSGEYMYNLLSALALVGVSLTLARYNSLKYTIRDLIVLCSAIFVYLILTLFVSAAIVGALKINVNYNFVLRSPIYLGAFDSFAYIYLAGARIPMLYSVTVIAIYILIALFSVGVIFTFDRIHSTIKSNEPAKSSA